MAVPASIGPIDLQVMASSPNPQPGLMRNLGRFFGHIVAGAKSDPSRTEVSRQVDQKQVNTPGGQVTLRRTVIEEVEFDQHAGEQGDERK
jgi:hypothetical protein